MIWRKPKHLELRRRCGLLLRPRTMGCTTKWLCNAQWVQVFIDGGHGGHWFDFYWLTPGGDVAKPATGHGYTIEFGMMGAPKSMYAIRGLRPIPFIDQFAEAKSIRPKAPPAPSPEKAP